MSNDILLLSQVKFLIVTVLNKIVARRIIITQSFLIIDSAHPPSNYTKEIVCSRQLCLHYLLLALFYTKIRL
jgi:hypothetical protein